MFVCLFVQYRADAAFSVAKRSDFIAVLLPISCHGQYLYFLRFLFVFVCQSYLYLLFCISIHVCAAKDPILLLYYQV